MQKGTVELDEVVLEADVIDRDSELREKRTLYREASYTLDFKDIKGFPSGDLFSMLVGRIPGFTSQGRIRGNTISLYLLNGMPIEDVNIIPFMDIDFVDIIIGPRAAIYGPDGRNGVIAIYTLNGPEKLNRMGDDKEKGVLRFEHPGYGLTKKFYEPIYDVENKENTKLDYRSTIYWNPTIKLDQEGKANISFYTSDAVSPYHVLLEGISLDGQIISSETYLNIPKD